MQPPQAAQLSQLADPAHLLGLPLAVGRFQAVVAVLALRVAGAVSLLLPSDLLLRGGVAGRLLLTVRLRVLAVLRLVALPVRLGVLVVFAGGGGRQMLRLTRRPEQHSEQTLLNTTYSLSEMSFCFVEMITIFKPK